MNQNDRQSSVSSQQLAELQQRRKVYEAALSSTPDLVYVFGLDHRFIYANEALLSMWGRTWDEAIGKNCLELGYPDWHAAMHSREIEQVIATRQPIKGEVPFHGTQGRRIYEYIFVPVVGASGKVEMVAGTTRDVTDRKHDHEEIERLNRDLQQRISEFETLMEVMPIGIAVARDAECQDIRVNPAFAKMLRLAPDQNASKTSPAAGGTLPFRCLDIHGQEIPDEQLPMQVAAREKREVRDQELDIVHPDGTVIRLLEYAAPLLDDRGRTRGAVGSFVDITELRAAALRRQFLVNLDHAIRPLIDPADITAVSARLLGEYLKADRCAYADVEADEDTFNLIGDFNRDVPSIVGRYTFTQFGREVLRLMRANQPYVVSDIDHHTPPPENWDAYRKTQIQAVVCVPLHKAGKFVAAMAVHQKTPRVWTAEEVDLVMQVASRCWESIERSRVARDLQQSEERFRQLANTIPQLAWMARPDGWIFWYNDRWYDYTGTTPEEMQGWGWERVHDPVELQRMLPRWRQALTSGEPWDDLFPLRRHDGEFRWHLSRAQPLRDAQGNILLWFGTNTDVTEQRRLAEEREALLHTERAARAEAERISQMKDEFLATLSHELRTPLNAILGYATLLRVANLSGADLVEAISTIERNARLQAQLIEDLLDMNRIISGKIRLDVQQVDLIDVLDEAVAAVKPSAEARDITLMRIVDPEAGIVRGDPARLQQVVWNLLSNAIKFTPKGGHVHLSLEREESQVEISVSDTGQGIDPEFLPHVFDRFRQADASTTRRHGGLGLGLSIVRQLVELHGGTIGVSSPGVNQGATFVVSLPISSLQGEAPVADATRTRSELAEAAGVETELRGVRVLVVDDEPDATALLKHVLERCQAEVERAGSVAEAMELLSAHSFDIIVSDIGMPGEDGYQFIRRVRSLENPHRNVPAVALTAFARAEDRKKAALAGFQTHLSKPVEAAELVAVVANLARRDGLT